MSDASLRLFACLFLLGVTLSFPCDASASERQATPTSSIRLKDGFQIELLRSAQPDEGSWICMTFDDKGRLLLADDQAGVLRMTLPVGDKSPTIERLAGTENLKHCRGLLYAYDSLFACATNGEGIYRLRDADGDGTFETQELICPLEYESRYGHGANQLKLGPDGMIYVAIGNDVWFPENVSANSPYHDPHDDWLLPNPQDGEHDERVGYVLKMSPDGKTREIAAGGFRNQVDVAFNDAGELFTWDADMEWDVGLPWYRPTRINHVVSAGEYGWRRGTGKWPTWFPDSLPSTLDTGLGSPTGLTFGGGSQWPQRYRGALYAADWQNGRLLMIDLLEAGASYQGKSEVFAEGSPLNICDLEFGPDGALYFITGGRGSQSGLYRITYTGDEKTVETDQLPAPSAEAAAARKVRHELEALHVREDAAQLPLIWSHLGSDDVWIRSAARLALENQPVETWRDQVQAEPDSKARHTALMALARVGGPADQAIVLQGLAAADFATASPDELLWLLRTMQLTLIRQGQPAAESRDKLLGLLQKVPASDRFAANWLQSELLIALNADMALESIGQKLATAATQEEQIQYVKLLLRSPQHRSRPLQAQLLQWFQQNKRLPGGKLVQSTVLGMRKEFEATLTEQDRENFQKELAQLNEPAEEGEGAALQSSRPLVRDWTVDDLESQLASLNSPSGSSQAGKTHLAAALCLRCHRFGDRGGQVGPDLTNVGKRMDRRTLLESIVNPSKEIDPKYGNSVYLLENGQVISGRTTMVNRNQIGVETDPLTGQSVTIERQEIAESKVSPVSPMPPGLLNVFTAEEVRDLVAYLRKEE
ncbi:c-type cytochrome [Blastopirellula sp. JC732]|uniref:C-type cytochrome n=1 Tax=Blastopirellula sediminis TaxID=2894196 RepID=A0A9X1ML38_9BACT|nr:c-type cytochrome [Blastopirellula sediminis]MCC9607708.1 c-type cytochrome [Blastopirellula sediminis]MCC9627499.1 c-type cytochrome [Blastopirellula sediminis]